MRALQKHHIVDVFVWVDDEVIHRPTTQSLGRPSMLLDSEVVTILLWDGLTEPHPTLRGLYDWIKRDYADYFPRLPAYQNFVAHCHRVIPRLHQLLEMTLHTAASFRIVDSTILPVCSRHRSDAHRVAKPLAGLTKNHQGWHYGFKLHVAIDRRGGLAALVFTSASEHDVHHLERLVNGATRLVVGDSHYCAREVRQRLWQQWGIWVVAPPHHLQRKQLMTEWQRRILSLRPKIETVFDYLKEHMHLVSSFPRSIEGYFVHYLRILAGYQMRVS